MFTPTQVIADFLAVRRVSENLTSALQMKCFTAVTGFHEESVSIDQIDMGAMAADSAVLTKAIQLKNDLDIAGVQLPRDVLTLCAAASHLLSVREAVRLSEWARVSELVEVEAEAEAGAGVRVEVAPLQHVQEWVQGEGGGLVFVSPASTPPVEAVTSFQRKYDENSVQAEAGATDDSAYTSFQRKYDENSVQAEAGATDDSAYTAQTLCSDSTEREPTYTPTPTPTTSLSLSVSQALLVYWDELKMVQRFVGERAVPMCFCSVLFCSVLFYSVLLCCTVQCITVQCSTVQYSAVQCSVNLCCAVLCTVVYHSTQHCVFNLSRQEVCSMRLTYSTCVRTYSRTHA